MRKIDFPFAVLLAAFASIAFAGTGTAGLEAEIRRLDLAHADAVAPHRSTCQLRVRELT